MRCHFRCSATAALIAESVLSQFVGQMRGHYTTSGVDGQVNRLMILGSSSLCGFSIMSSKIIAVLHCYFGHGSAALRVVSRDGVKWRAHLPLLAPR